jgi:hypothetical protein
VIISQTTQLPLFFLSLCIVFLLAPFAIIVVGAPMEGVIVVGVHVEGAVVVGAPICMEVQAASYTFENICHDQNGFLVAL